MTCPICGGKTLVSYTVTDCDAVYRWRKCRECNHGFYTTECESDGTHFKKLDYQRREKFYSRRRKHS